MNTLVQLLSINSWKWSLIMQAFTCSTSRVRNCPPVAHQLEVMWESMVEPQECKLGLKLFYILFLLCRHVKGNRKIARPGYECRLLTESSL